MKIKKLRIWKYRILLFLSRFRKKEPDRTYNFIYEDDLDE